MKLLEQLKDLEHRKGLYSKEEYETKFKEITNAATDEEILQAAKEAKETLGRGYNIDFFRRKIYSAVIIRYGHKPLKGSYMPGKTRSLLKKLDLYIPKYDFEKTDNKVLTKRLEEIIFSHVGLEGILKHYGAYEDIKKCMDQYAREVAQASLEKAAEVVSRNYNDSYECKQDILNPNNITLL
ncbi:MULTISPECIES: hypothetical protein [Elizabethkingia]|uniref:Uncharacterized protein n=1 Tax=Elizabethkingia anophelis TaxID=1117645 RepID=A0A494J251_9FLAO|nr:hypothetical protein [Elizabethkingia anophelis]AQX52522.1 hypothetical protein AYC66_18370 [Elizabethkingia anophelis]EJC8061941.1 hypothetical protein [Elizabethkingia anophelis]MCL1640031.1 hypothetical protein [Elizabethkingia anophelis]MCL1646578.1 hypothetical protein [Elizabethkingia anophelis]MCT3926902.1 hypothetical protein [Elizabethkingia anophelis]